MVHVLTHIHYNNRQLYVLVTLEPEATHIEWAWNRNRPILKGRFVGLLLRAIIWVNGSYSFG